MIPIIDSHLDLAWNAVGFERDLTLPLAEMNAAEAGCCDSAARGRGVVSLAEMRRGGILLCFATLLSRARPARPIPPDGARRTDLDHRSANVAHCAAHAQLAWYEQMERHGHMRIIRNVADLEDHWGRAIASPEDAPIGMILVMEGADPVTEPAELEYWHSRGLRQVNLVHYGHNRYAAGTGVEGGLTSDGRALLAECQRLGVALDVTHLADQALDEALEVYEGPLLASHHNCRALVPAQRQLPDEQLRKLIDRQAVIGVALDNWMLHPSWKTGVTPREEVTLQTVADHVDHLCQLAGHCESTAIGSDLDGGYGTEQTPADVNGIADVQNLAAILDARGYDEPAIAAIFHGNWLRWLRRQLPATGGATATPHSSRAAAAATAPC